MTAAPPAVSLLLPDTLSSAEAQTAIAELKAINADKVEEVGGILQEEFGKPIKFSEITSDQTESLAKVLFRIKEII